VDIDDRPITMQRKIRDAEMEWVNYVLVVGQREIESGTLAVRDREMRGIRNITGQALTEEIRTKTTGKPYRSLTLPRELSKRPQF
jgi:threonyl-tRNA synthetase